MSEVKMKDKLKNLLKGLQDKNKKKEFVDEYKEFREEYYERQQ